MPTALITGANRGLGLEYARQYLQQGWEVIACTRRPNAPELAGLSSPQLRICELDVVDHPAVDALAEVLKDVSIDVLVNNAGTTGPKGAPECVAYSGFTNMDYTIWRQILEVNLLGAFKVATAFRHHLATADRGVLVNMSSDLGSVAQNTQGNMYSYRSSKAALNMIAKSFANEWPDIISIAMAPGWCQTELGGEGAEIPPAESVAEQIKAIEKLTIEHSGCFLDRFGEAVPW
ncbi:MAG: SDR family oxidoreductase [Gammaproteobacteria bacterium]|nr:SDR family oxidoreductase [Gammaproteobacteria bacterium]